MVNGLLVRKRTKANTVDFCFRDNIAYTFQIPTTIGQYEPGATADASIRYTMWNRDGIRSYQAFPTADQKMS